MKTRVRLRGCPSLLLACAVILSGGTLVPTLADEDIVLPLPAWSEQDWDVLTVEPDSIPLGGFLWPDGFGPDSLIPPESLPARRPPDGLLGDGSTGLFSQRGNRGFLLFIPKPQSGVTPPPNPTPPHDLVEVGPEFLQECEDLEPVACLLDPHRLLAETASEDLRRLLTYHAGEASTFANFLLLDSDEQLPAAANLSRIARGRLVEDHACLAVYPMGEPWRARVFMTREITDGVPADYLRGILQACVQDAMQASDPVEQLQRFATQLSIRLIWMERAHATLFAPPEAAVATGPRPPSTLAEILHAPEIVSHLPLLALHWKSAALIITAALVGLLVLVLLCHAILRWRRRRARNSVWILPEVETKPRFGAPHCGQGGAWIRYG